MNLARAGSAIGVSTTPLLALIVACGGAEAPAPPSTAQKGTLESPLFAPKDRGLDRAAASGLIHLDRSGGSEKATILEANGPGIALLDLGSDGDWDVAMSSGAASLAALLGGSGSDLALFSNDGSGSFSSLPGPGLNHWGTGLAVGDLDNDGDGDLVSGAFGDLTVLLQREGALATTARATHPFDQRAHARLIPGDERAAGLPPDWVTSLAVLDADRDGNLDLYVGRYLEFDPVAPPLGRLGSGTLAVSCRWKAQSVFCGPRGMRAQSDSLWRGNGLGGFAQVDWIDDGPGGFTLAVHAFDADMDGDTDLYVANDSVANRFWINQLDGAGGSMMELADMAGIALSPDGAPEAGMGITSGDVNGDGLFDLVLTNFSSEPTHLFLGSDVGFDLTTHRYGLGRSTRKHLSWSCNLADLDADGALELFVANGHVYPQADAAGTGTSYGQLDQWFELGGGQATEPQGSWYRAPNSLFGQRGGSRGSAVGDLNGDGIADLVVTTIDGAPRLSFGQATAARRVLAVRLEGTSERTPRDGQGALVLVTDSHGTQMRHVHAGDGYQSASATDLLFGFAPSDEDLFRALEVRWPSGRSETVEPRAWNQLLVLREAHGVVATEFL